MGDNGPSTLADLLADLNLKISESIRARKNPKHVLAYYKGRYPDLEDELTEIVDAALLARETIPKIPRKR